MDTWREAKRNYEAMLQVVLHPGSGIDHGSLLFLRSKILEAERKIHQYSTKPHEEVGRAVLAKKRTADLLNLEYVRDEAQKSAKKEKKDKEDKKKKDKKGEKKDKEDKQEKKVKDKKGKADKWQTPSHHLPEPEPVHLALVTQGAQRSSVVATPLPLLAGPPPLPPPAGAPPPLPLPNARPPLPRPAAPVPAAAAGHAPAATPSALGQGAPPHRLPARGGRKPRTEFEHAELAAEGDLEKSGRWLTSARFEARRPGRTGSPLAPCTAKTGWKLSAASACGRQP